jgi:hypothetical protein
MKLRPPPIEAAPAADQDHCLDAVVLHALLQRFVNPFRDAGAQRVDRRIVDRDDANGAMLFVVDEVRHGCFL